MTTPDPPTLWGFPVEIDPSLPDGHIRLSYPDDKEPQMPIPLIDEDAYEEIDARSPSGNYWVMRVQQFEWPDGYRTVGFRVYSRNGPVIDRRWRSDALADLEQLEATADDRA